MSEWYKYGLGKIEDAPDFTGKNWSKISDASFPFRVYVFGEKTLFLRWIERITKLLCVQEVYERVDKLNFELFIVFTDDISLRLKTIYCLGAIRETDGDWNNLNNV